MSFADMKRQDIPQDVWNEFHRVCDQGDLIGMEMHASDFEYSETDGLTIDGTPASQWITYMTME